MTGGSEINLSTNEVIATDAEAVYNVEEVSKVIAESSDWDSLT